jgi:hypothetical protein
MTLTLWTCRPTILHVLPRHRRFARSKKQVSPKWAGRVRVVGLLLLLGGCASLGVRTEGTSGPIAWRIADLRGETRDIRGRAVDGRAFTLVIRNIGDRTLILTKMTEKRYQPGTGSNSTSYAVRWELLPGAERKIRASQPWSVIPPPPVPTAAGGAADVSNRFRGSRRSEPSG